MADGRITPDAWWRPARRKDRALSHQAALEVLDRNRHGVLALAWPDGRPYAVPLLYVRRGEVLYFHCAKEGQKLEIMRANPRGVLCVAETGAVVGAATRPCAASLTYSSVLAFGRLREVEVEAEKLEALSLLCRVLSVGLPAGTGAPADDFVAEAGRTTVLALEIEHLSGKART